MKHLFTIILSLLLLTACGERERNSQFLNRAEAIMNDSCEVALLILQDSIDINTLTTIYDIQLKLGTNWEQILYSISLNRA